MPVTPRLYLSITPLNIYYICLYEYIFWIIMRFSRTNQETLRRNVLSTSTNAYQNSNQTSFNFIQTGKPFYNTCCTSSRVIVRCDHYTFTYCFVEIPFSVKLFQRHIFIMFIYLSFKYLFKFQPSSCMPSTRLVTIIVNGANNYSNWTIQKIFHSEYKKKTIYCRTKNHNK